MGEDLEEENTGSRWQGDCHEENIVGQQSGPQGDTMCLGGKEEFEEERAFDVAVMDMIVRKR